MEQGSFEIDCIECQHPIGFSIEKLEQDLPVIACPGCQKQYGFGDKTLKRQLILFASLCKEIRKSEEILGDANVAVDVGPHHVKIPFKILLTRLKSTLDLLIGNRRVTVTCRVETANTK